MFMLGNRIFKIPKIILGLVGGIAGASVTLLPTVILWTISLGREHFKLDWAYMRGWPLFGGCIGAAGLILYSWRLARAIRQTRAKLKTD